MHFIDFILHLNDYLCMFDIRNLKNVLTITLKNFAPQSTLNLTYLI